MRSMTLWSLGVMSVLCWSCADATTGAEVELEPADGLPMLPPSSEDPSKPKPSAPNPTDPKAPNPVPVDAKPPAPADATVDFVAAAGQAPALSPQLLTLARVGGAGDQYIRQVYFTEDGRIVGQGDGFSVTYDVTGQRGATSGDLSMSSDQKLDVRPRLPGDPGRSYSHAATGLTFAVGYRQAGRNLQTPIFRAFKGDERQWALWGHAGADIEAASLGADSRCYQAWGMPNGQIGVQCWTDGGNSVLARDPRDLKQGSSWSQGAYQSGAGGMSSLYALVDPSDGGRVVSGTFVASHVHKVAVDGWGRVYVANPVSSRSNPSRGVEDVFGVGEEVGSGLAILAPTLKDVLFNARVGGACAKAQGSQGFGSIALRDNILVLGGTTCGGDWAQRNPVQQAPGQGQDGLIAIIRLW